MCFKVLFERIHRLNGTIYGLVTKKIAVENLRKIIVTPKEDNLFLYIIIYGVTIIFLKFPTAIFLVSRPYMVSRTHTYRSTLRQSNSWQHARMEKLAENDLAYFYLRHVVIVVTAVTTSPYVSPGRAFPGCPIPLSIPFPSHFLGCRGRDRIVAGFMPSCSISANNQYSFEF